MASVLINGSPSAEFPISRGLRQGDPLSPFLFIIAMEGLNAMLSKAVADGLFKGVVMGNDLAISHLIYADDVIILGEWSRRNVVNIVRVLRCFFVASGLKINFQKSHLLGVGVEEDSCRDMARLIGCGCMRAPFHYLGLTVGGNMGRVRSWDGVMEKFRTRLASWKVRMLSIGGRLTLIKSVLGSLASYLLSIFKIPITVCKAIEGLRNKFFIGAGVEDRKITWTAWDQVLASFEKGGLEVGSLYGFNRALLFKWWWRFMRGGHYLWSRVIREIHGNDGGRGRKPKWNSIWGNIIRASSDLIDKGINPFDFCEKRVGNGADTLFWFDRWIGNTPLKDRFPRLFRLDSNSSALVRDRVNVSDWSTVLRRQARGGGRERPASCNL